MRLKETMRRLVVEACGGCTIQHDGWPCNSCFHSLDLPLKHNIHAYWIAILSYRGDYPSIPRNCAMNALLAELKEVLERGN